MALKHNNLKRILHRSFEELKASYDVAKSISIKAAYITLRAKIDIQIMNRNGMKEPDDVKRRLLSKHKIMLDFLDKKYSNYWDKYQFSKDIKDSNPKYHNKIWVCWWQGLDNAPDIVKACIKTIKANSEGAEVILITDDNYKNYISFPDYVEEKRKKGLISRTIFSDLLRLNLLSTYGGIWIDSTFFCVHSNFDSYMKLPIWSIKRPEYGHCSVACGYFANYSLGCSYQYRWAYKVVLDFLYNYWKENNKLIDYLLTDYAIVLSQKHIAEVSELFSGIQPNNPNCDELVKVLNEPFDETKWNMLKNETGLFKLTWKQEFSSSANGQRTFYAMIIDGTLR